MSLNEHREASDRKEDGAVTDIQELLKTETATFVAALQRLGDMQWNTPSLCAGWTVRDAAAHLLMPYELSTPGFLARMVTARFNFDAVADRWAKRDTRKPTALVTALARPRASRSTFPGRRLRPPSATW